MLAQLLRCNLLLVQTSQNLPPSRFAKHSCQVDTPAKVMIRRKKVGPSPFPWVVVAYVTKTTSTTTLMALSTSNSATTATTSLTTTRVSSDQRPPVFNKDAALHSERFRRACVYTRMATMPSRDKMKQLVQDTGWHGYDRCRCRLVAMERKLSVGSAAGLDRPELRLFANGRCRPQKGLVGKCRGNTTTVVESKTFAQKSRQTATTTQTGYRE